MAHKQRRRQMSNMFFCSTTHDCPCGRGFLSLGYHWGHHQVEPPKCEPCGRTMRVTSTTQRQITEEEKANLMANAVW